MPENDRLLKTVLENPDADEPRLAYAAWCEQQRDEATKARAEFIRAQISLVNYTAPQPPYPNELYYQISKLGDTYRETWSQSLASITGNIYHFDRGFIELVTLSATQFLKRVPQLFSLAPIRHLRLASVGSIAPDLFSSPYLQKIRSLELDRTGLGDAGLALLAASPYLDELRWLSIAENQISLTGADALVQAKGLKSLVYVNFAGNAVVLNEHYAYDNGYVVDSFMPEEGQDFERRHGPVRWLHHDAKTIANSVPDRFRF